MGDSLAKAASLALIFAVVIALAVVDMADLDLPGLVSTAIALR